MAETTTSSKISDSDTNERKTVLPKVAEKVFYQVNNPTPPTADQLEFHRDLCNLAKDILTFAVSRLYDFGPLEFNNVQKISNFVVKYFNECCKIMFAGSNEDEYLAKMINKIASTKIGKKYHHYDIWVLAFELVIVVLQKINFVTSRTTPKNHNEFQENKSAYMNLMLTEISEKLLDSSKMANQYFGCDEDHDFSGLNEEPFDIEVCFASEMDLGQDRDDDNFYEEDW